MLLAYLDDNNFIGTKSDGQDMLFSTATEKNNVVMSDPLQPGY